MIYKVLLTSFLAIIVCLISVQPVLGQENNDHRPEVSSRLGENSSNQISPGPSASPVASSTASASPEVSASPQVSPSPSSSPSSSPSPQSSVSPSPRNDNGQGQFPSEGNIIVVTDPSPSPTPTPTSANFVQPIAEPQLLTPLIVEDPSPMPSPSPSQPLGIQLTRKINPPDFGSLFDANHVQYYTKHGLPINLTLSFLFLSLALTLSGVLALSETFSFRGLWEYIKNGQWRQEKMSYYSMKKAVS